MTDVQAAALTALILFAFIALTAVICRDPKTCSLCGIALPRRRIVRHYLDHHSTQEHTMCDRTDWPCHNPEPHDAPRGCVHVSTTGSETEQGD